MHHKTEHACKGADFLANDAHAGHYGGKHTLGWRGEHLHTFATISLVLSFPCKIDFRLSVGNPPSVS